MIMAGFSFHLPCFSACRPVSSPGTAGSIFSRRPTMSDAQSIGYFVMAATQLLTLIVLGKKLFGKAECREIAPQPLKVRPDLDPADRFAPRVHAHPEYLSRADHEKLCAGRIDESRHAIKHATLDREAIQRQIDALSNLFQTSIKELNKNDETRASLIHQRINGVSEPLNQLVGRFENHMLFHGKGQTQ